MNRVAARRLLSAYFERPGVSLLVRLGVSPNAVTLSGLAIAAASAVLVGAGSLAAGGAVLLASGLLDLFDGALARATGRASSFGALLDSVVDRVSESAVLLGLLVYYLQRPNEIDATIGAVLVFVVVVASVLVSYVRARAEGLGIDCNIGVLTRPERVGVLVVGLVAGQWWLPATSAALAVIALLASVTVVQRVLHVRGELAEASR